MLGFRLRLAPVVAVVCATLLAVLPSCSQGDARAASNPRFEPAELQSAVPSLGALAKTFAATQAIDSAIAAEDGTGQPLKSAGVELGHPTTADSALKALEWVIYASGGYSVDEVPMSLRLDLSGSEGSVWVGIGDYGRGIWRWQRLDAPFSNPMDVAISNPLDAYRPADGVLFVALAVYDGSKLAFHGGSIQGSGIPVDRVNAFHRDGQTFITWPERADLTGEHYRVYRRASPIDSQDDLVFATLLYEVPKGTGNFYADRYNVEGGGVWQPRYLERYVVMQLGPPLPADIGMLVWTVDTADFDGAETGTGYYAVTVVPTGGSEDYSGLGNNLSSGPVVEAIADPTPVEVLRADQGKAHVYLQYMDLRNWNPTFHAPNEGNQYYGLNSGDPSIQESIQYAYCYTVGEPDPLIVPPMAVYPVILNLHGWAGNTYGPDLVGAQYWDAIEVRPLDIGETWFFGFARDHDYHQSQTIGSGDAICNYTEYRILRMLHDLLRDPVLGPQCDRNRIYVYGHSMGGSGALALALRYPTLFAAAYASQPMTNYLTDPVWQDDVQRKFGMRMLDLPVDLSVPGDLVPLQDLFDGTGVYAWQNHESNAQGRLQDDCVPIGVGHGRLDTAIHWPEQGRGLYGALDAGRRCWGGYVDDRDHQWMGFLGCPPAFDPDGSLVPFGSLHMVLNESVPGLSNCSRDGSLPPVGPPSIAEQYNHVIDWSSSWDPWDGAPFEDTGIWRMSFRTTDGAEATVDITPRRLQLFQPWEGGVPYTWYNRRMSDNSIVDSGIVSTGVSDSLLTVPDFVVTPEGNRLTIEGPLPPG